MIKVQNGIATRDPIPGFFAQPDPASAPEWHASLLDLSWTDPQFGLQDAAWWPEENADVALGTNKKWGAEVLTPDPDRKVVVVTRKQVAMTSAEKAARDALAAEQWATQIAARRYDAEVSGTVVGGMPIATDDRSKLLINGAALRANRSSDYVLRWKTSDGFVDLTADQVLAVADAVSEHVQACFDREDALLAAVADGTITEAMVGESWPERP